MPLWGKLDPGVRAGEILLVPVDHLSVVAEDVDVGGAFFQRNGGGPGAGIFFALHIHPLVLGNRDVEEGGRARGGPVVDPPEATAFSFRTVFETNDGFL